MNFFMAIDLFMSVLRSYMSVQTNEGGWVMVIFPLVMVILPKIVLTFSMLHTFFSYKVILQSYLKSLAKKNELSNKYPTNENYFYKK